MPIANIQDAHEVERGLQTILTAHDADGRAREIRKLFVETLDFDHEDNEPSLLGIVSLEQAALAVDPLAGRLIPANLLRL